MKIEQEHYEVLDTGDYLASVDKVEAEEGQYGPQLKFTFKLEEQDRTLTGWANQKFSNRSKLYKWTKALLYKGAAIPRDYNLNTLDLVGKVGLLTVTKEARDDGSEYNKIEGILPAEPEAVNAMQEEDGEIPF